jgi:hypothetical protein
MVRVRSHQVREREGGEERGEKEELGETDRQTEVREERALRS